jgi:hypothetical protein
MNDTRLGDAIVARLMALNGDIDGTEEARLKTFWRAIADEIISEIQSFGVVNTTGADPQGGTVTSTGTVT